MTPSILQRTGATLSAALVFALLFSATGALADGDPEAGKKAFRKCATCHKVEPGKNFIGPDLHGVYGQKAGTVEGFSYSPALRKSDIVWNDENLHKYLANPRKFIPGNRMGFAGLRSEKEREDVIAYMKTLE